MGELAKRAMGGGAKVQVLTVYQGSSNANMYFTGLTIKPSRIYVLKVMQDAYSAPGTVATITFSDVASGSGYGTMINSSNYSYGSLYPTLEITGDQIHIYSSTTTYKFVGRYQAVCIED